ncbi:MAG: L-threonine 3-dehydrogenase [Paracoccus denitrificans]|uniref:L-threonine 3-dehydrogenase n=1 Tax=Paracoccus denitrificans TaxID=266 RepID=A0A2W4ZS36_PARDE|nr:MAG: L-threonine 3-dehydrogenase [Paracoccus denitrificans]PZO83542.1 MAG: L-threonine 3-dehydrogenase [Paracoccus denitrificans]TKW64161.1 MAG: L-threonine 3-dehydrogenase [Paracoccus denitrificans]
MSNMMKALVKARPEPGLWMENVPVPEPGPNEVLIKVGKSAICGTDVHIWNWDAWAAKTVPVPLVTGHEFSGVIADVGSAVTRFEPGQRVSGEGHITCGACRNCRAGRGHLCRNTLGVGVHRAGSFAEYLCLPESNVVPIPDDVPDEIAAIFDPFGNAVHTALSFDCVGEDVLVTGAGPIGIMGALVAQRAGARKVVITDINPIRLNLARKMGLENAIDTSKDDLAEVMARIGMTEGFDIGLEMSGAAPAFRQMIELMNNGGKIAILGIAPTGFEIDWNNVIFKMLHLKGIYGREMYETWYKMIAFVQSGLDLTPLITHRLGIDDFETGFAAMRSGEAGKVVLDWGR